MSNLNPNIRKTVALLNGGGFVTCDSGDGVTHDYECDRDHGYVVVKLDEARKLISECHRLQAYLKPCLKNSCQAKINGSYDPEDRTAFIDFSPITDDDLTGDPPDESYQREYWKQDPDITAVVKARASSADDCGEELIGKVMAALDDHPPTDIFQELYWEDYKEGLQKYWALNERDRYRAVALALGEDLDEYDERQRRLDQHAQDEADFCARMS